LSQAAKLFLTPPTPVSARPGEDFRIHSFVRFECERFKSVADFLKTLELGLCEKVIQAKRGWKDKATMNISVIQD